MNHGASGWLAAALLGLAVVALHLERRRLLRALRTERSRRRVGTHVPTQPPHEGASAAGRVLDTPAPAAPSGPGISETPPAPHRP